ncbi:hypothetical protein BS47DRAFT_948505 [Hydnum rufescens UP504]|uniref:Uncharacterized protein n=1 Tax=Hydnum rufescens UP504 TaxID=1448309 RepID=A0A9P6DTZ1_9AGAM|nr:hypothetical protein BS47DRAFT_948505 [Hydnum rufescens UP504]
MTILMRVNHGETEVVRHHLKQLWARKQSSRTFLQGSRRGIDRLSLCCHVERPLSLAGNTGIRRLERLGGTSETTIRQIGKENKGKSIRQNEILPITGTDLMKRPSTTCAKRSGGASGSHSFNRENFTHGLGDG